MENYLSVLEDSLKKKLQILDELATYTMEQQELLKAEELDYDAFDQLVEKKDPLVQMIMELDQGFETVYDRIKEQLIGHKERYVAQIRTLQDLISELTDKSVKLQAMEQRNKTAVEQQFRNSNYVPPQFLDDKK